MPHCKENLDSRGVLKNNKHTIHASHIALTENVRNKGDNKDTVHS